jgi:hypothetical protein
MKTSEEGVVAEARGGVKNNPFLRNVSRETLPNRYQNTAELVAPGPELAFHKPEPEPFCTQQLALLPE